MKAHLRIFSVLGSLLLLAVATSYGSTLTVGSGGGYSTIGAAITAANGGDLVQLLAGNTFTETVNISKAITLAGIDTSAKIHGSITVSVGGATIQLLVVYGSSGAGISASGITGLTLTNVVSRNNTGSGAQLTNCSSVTVTGGSYSGNLDQGFNATGGGSSYTLSNVTANNNGNSTPQGSGINIKGVTGPSSITNCIANNNHFHGVSVGDGATSLTIDGGTFTGNGTAGNATTGGGINIVAQGTTTTSSITVKGSVTSSNNTTAGIYIFADNATVNAINTVTIGATGSITLSNNGSTNGTYNGGAGVLVYGIVSAVHISNTTFTKGAAPGAGLLNLGDGTYAGSPQGTQVTGSTFNNYTSAYPAVSLTDGAGHSSPSATNNVAATNNTFTFTVLVRAILQGPFVSSSGLMRTTLASSLIPLTQPYGVAPYNVTRFNYGGSEQTTRSALTSNSITDWVLIELRATSNVGAGAVARKAGLLKNDGNVYDVDGTTAGVLMTETQDGYDLSHYIVFKHRNHLPVMSATKPTLPNTAAYDFTASSGMAIGTDALVALPSSSLFGIPSGDVDFNGGVGATDISAVVADVGEEAYSLYDIDCNGGVGATDISAVVGNVGQEVQVP